MRKTKNLPWMGRTVATAIAVIAGLGLFVGTAAAQMTVYDYNDGMAWWNAYDCAAMMVLLPALVDTDAEAADAQAESDDDHEDRVCVMYADLENRDKIIIEDFIASTDTDAHETNEKWWDAQSVVNRQILGGALAIVGNGTANSGSVAYVRYGAQTTAAATSGFATLFEAAYDDLRASAMEIVDMAGYALSGRAMMTDEEEEEEEAPALPLVGIGLLGLLLAGRGAWLRRRA